MAHLLLGPLLRYTGSTQATVWVETDAPCEVTVLGGRARTFAVEGHHYALVVVDDLEPGSVTPYEVRLDDQRVWPLDDERPPSAIHTREHERQSRLVFGSCRVGAPQRAAVHALERAPKGLGIDALWAFSRRLQAGASRGPTACCCSATRSTPTRCRPRRSRSSAARRDVSLPPGEQVADFEEYTRLHRESWSDPDVRWLLSTVPSTMIFDDHDVHDDWNISGPGSTRCARCPGGGSASSARSWPTGSTSTSATSPRRSSPRSRCSRSSGGRGRRAAAARVRPRVDHETTASRFAFHRDFGGSRLVVVDSRAARVLADGRRDMVDAEEWDWIVEHARGDYDHLILASTVPVFMAEGIHYLEAWNEAVCAGRWGRTRPGQPRSCGGRSTSSTGRRSSARSPRWWSCSRPRASGRGAATIVLIGGDVHTAYDRRGRARRRPGEPRLPGRLLAVPQPAPADGAPGRARHAQPPGGLAARGSPGPPVSGGRTATGSSSRRRRSTTRSPCSSSTSGPRRSRSRAAAAATTRARCSSRCTSACFPRRSSSSTRLGRRCGSNPALVPIGRATPEPPRLVVANYDFEDLAAPGRKLGGVVGSLHDRRPCIGREIARRHPARAPGGRDEDEGRPVAVPTTDRDVIARDQRQRRALRDDVRLCCDNERHGKTLRGRTPRSHAARPRSADP